MMSMSEGSTPSPVASPARYCRKCWYVLDGLAKNECPECGRKFDPQNKRTYRTRPRGKWWLRTGVRAFFITALFASVSIALLYRRHVQEEQTIAWVQKHNGAYHAEPLGPVWFAEMFEEYDIPWIQSVCEINFTGAVIESDDLHQLTTVQNLRALHLDLFDDEALEHVGKCQGIRFLTLRNAAITNVGLRHLTALPELTSLYVEKAGFAEKEFSQIGQNANLSNLWMKNVTLRNDGLIYLQEMPLLEVLRIERSNVTDVGLVHLGQIRSLVFLDLQNTEITDEGLTHLSELKNLRKLVLSNTSISGDGLMRLKDLPKLTCIYLDGTNVTATDAERFTRESPSQELLYGPFKEEE